MPSAPTIAASLPYNTSMRESDLLRHIYRTNPTLDSVVTIGPGDDMGAMSLPPNTSELLTSVDQLADGVHVDLTETPLAKIAHKAIARSLSDVAAMGAVPIGAVVAACLPKHFGQDKATTLFDRMRQTAEDYSCPLFGGDIALWDYPLLLSLTVQAVPQGVQPVLRRGAQVGDVICVSGELGGSLETVDGYTHHLDFDPRLDLGRSLAKSEHWRPHCMIDLSDGLAVDLGHLCRAADGNIAAIVDVDRLPIRRAARVAARRDHRPPWRHAVGDGEDYELCFTLSPQQADSLINDNKQQVKITRIGVIVGGDGQSIEGAVRVHMPNGAVEDVTDLGWEHRD